MFNSDLWYWPGCRALANFSLACCLCTSLYRITCVFDPCLFDLDFCLALHQMYYFSTLCIWVLPSFSLPSHTVTCTWPSSPRVVLFEKPSCYHDGHSHIGLGVLWKIIVTQHSPLLHKQMQLEIVLCREECIY